MPSSLGSIGFARSSTSAPVGGPLRTPIAGATRISAALRAIGATQMTYPGTGLMTTRSTARQSPPTSFAGSTSTSSVRVANRRIYVYDRTTGRCINSAISNANGDLTIRGLPVASDRYFAVDLQDEAVDPGSFNAQVFDHLTQP